MLKIKDSISPVSRSLDYHANIKRNLSVKCFCCRTTILPKQTILRCCCSFLSGYHTYRYWKELWCFNHLYAGWGSTNRTFDILVGLLNIYVYKPVGRIAQYASTNEGAEELHNEYQPHSNPPSHKNMSRRIMSPADSVRSIRQLLRKQFQPQG